MYFYYEKTIGQKLAYFIAGNSESVYISITTGIEILLLHAEQYYMSNNLSMQRMRSLEIV